MQKPNLEAVSRNLLKQATEATNGRAAETIYGGHEKVLRQTMIAMREGTGLAEHESPGDATLLVVKGRVRLNAGTDSWEGRDGDFLVIPDARHSLDAVSDAVVLLSVAKR